MYKTVLPQLLEDCRHADSVTLALPTLLALPGGNSSPIWTCAIPICATPIDADLAEVVDRAEDKLVADRPPKVEADREPPRDERPAGSGIFAWYEKERNVTRYTNEKVAEALELQIIRAKNIVYCIGMNNMVGYI